MLTVTDVRWFSGTSCVGIVKAIDDHSGVKYYIGSASNIDEIFDADHIMRWGAKFPNEVGDLLFGVTQ